MTKRGNILVVDDNEDVLFTLKILLRPLVENVTLCRDPAQINSLVSKNEYDVILLDMNFSLDASTGKEGFYWLDRILAINAQAVVIFITAYADTEKTVRAIKAGATDFIPKPWQNEKLLATVSSALQLSFSRAEVKQLKEQRVVLTALPDTEEEAIGSCAAMRDIFHTVTKLAETDANILLLGENGTGKDMIARSIYRHSSRAEEVYIPIDLGSIPENLFESELFGFEKGAFTDARKSKPGRMEMATGGSLFLNEIGNLTLALQAKLLSAIEQKQVFRLGATNPAPVDIRFICATNIDLYKAIDEGTFREDLLYRINTVEIHIPPLRERGDDILLLAEFFLQRYTKKYRKCINGFTAETKQKLLEHHWPGNVRELQHAVERAVILSDSIMLKGDDFIFRPAIRRTPAKESFNLEEMEKDTIRQVMFLAGGNISQAAGLLGITRTSLYRRLEKYRL